MPCVMLWLNDICLHNNLYGYSDTPNISLPLTTFASLVTIYSLIQDFVVGLSALSRGTVQDKLRWIFSLYDLDGDGVLTKDELYRMISAIYDLLGRSGDIHADDAATRQHAERVYEVSS